MALDEINKRIREKAKELLTSGKVDVVLGYQKGTIPMTVAPLFAKNEDDCDKLIWSSFATMNLALYLPEIKSKVALIAKGCDARSAVGQVVENQIKRENLYIIGVPCNGMMDSAKIKKTEKRDIKSVEEHSDSCVLIGDDFQLELSKKDFLRRNCQDCSYPSPPVSDELIENKPAVATPDSYADLEELAKKSPAEKAAYFKDLVANCLRCYACRNACPLCYCPICFVDETRPQWLGKSQDPTDVLTFHMLRGFHCAGRCTSCGACESACPVNIKVREFNRIMESEVKKSWNYEAGLSFEEKPPLNTYKIDDKAEFIK